MCCYVIDAHELQLVLLRQRDIGEPLAGIEPKDDQSIHGQERNVCCQGGTVNFCRAITSASTDAVGETDRCAVNTRSVQNDKSGSSSSGCVETVWEVMKSMEGNSLASLRDRQTVTSHTKASRRVSGKIGRALYVGRYE